MNALMTLTMIFLNVIKTTGDCPRSCECKWKNGKESVFCENANMTEIPKQLDSGTQVLALTGNKLQKIGADEFFNARLLNLQKIFLSRCHLRSIDQSGFRKIINLVELDLSYNDLHSVPSHTFAFIKELRELRLNGNPIASLLNYAFQMMPHLTKLELSECRIAYVEIKAFQGLENSLEWLKLDRNKITNIKPQALVHLVNLHGLELSGNSWNCSCGLRTLREWMLRQNVPYSIPPLCKHPPRLSGKMWDKLELDEFACTPRIKAVSSLKNGEEGSNVTMTCSINGIPEPSIRWLRKNHIIANLSGTVSGARKKLYIVQITKQTSNLTILAADAQDNGVYVCRAENKAGKSEANITLTVTVKPVVKIWSLRMMIAVGVVSMLFATAVGLLTYCAWSLRNRKSYNQNPVSRRELLDGYEMKHKYATGYNKIMNYRNHCSFNAMEKLRGIADRDTESDGRTAEVTGSSRSESINFSSSYRARNMDKMEWSFLKTSVAEDKLSEPNYSRLSPDLYKPKFDGQVTHGNSSNTWDSGDSSLLHPLLSSNPVKLATQNLSLETVQENFPFFTNALSENQEKYPDLLELPRNEENLLNNNSFSTIPRKRSYKVKRARHGSLGSESQSPLLPENSGDSCDSNYSFNGRTFFNKNSSLPTSPCSLSQTPILNILDESSNIFSESPTMLKYKSWELEKFLKEYQNLQDQLYKMKESCENLKEDNLKFRENEDSSNAVESVTISKMISPIFLDNSSYKTNIFDEANNIECLYTGSEFLEEDNNNSNSLRKNKTKLKPVLRNRESYWSSRNKFLKTSPNSGLSFYKS